MSGRKTILSPRVGKLVRLNAGETPRLLSWHEPCKIPAVRYWLVKSEPSTYSIDDFARDKITDWSGVRNYQARNFLCEMKKGEKVLIYHSNATPPAVVGIAVVHSPAAPDKTQFDRRSQYFDEKATRDKPRWFCPDLKFISKLPHAVSLAELKKDPGLAEMILLRKGSRLSVMPLTAKEFEIIAAKRK